MIPVILAAAAIGSAYAQWRTSQDAAKASKEERDRIAGIYAKIQQPNFDPSSITPEDYQVVQKYMPQVAPYVKELNPTVITQTSGMAAGRQAQMDALNKLRQVSSSEHNPELTAQLQQAQQKAAEQANSQSQSIMQQQARRGMLGSGNMLAAQLQAGSGAMQSEANTGQNAAIEAYRQRMDALRGGAQLGGQIHQEDVGMQARNADILNNYNARSANDANRYNQYAANQANQGQQYNIEQAQNVANANVGQHNTYNTQNQARRNAIAQQVYGNQLNYAQGQQGLAQSNINALQQNARDTNNAIAGVTSGASTVGMNAYNQNRQDARERYKKTGSWDEPEDGSGGNNG